GARHLLLVLDNCEHLIDAVAESVEIITHACPRISIVATSRETLRIEGEYVYRVPPLGVPAEHDRDPDVVRAASSVELFIARISAAQVTLSPDLSDLLELGTICRRLDGIPLAIEFAASRVAAFGVRQLAALLDNRFALLTAGRRTALPRHQTL